MAVFKLGKWNKKKALLFSLWFKHDRLIQWKKVCKNKQKNTRIYDTTLNNRCGYNKP